MLFDWTLNEGFQVPLAGYSPWVSNSQTHTHTKNKIKFNHTKKKKKKSQTRLTNTFTLSLLLLTKEDKVSFQSNKISFKINFFFSKNF